MADHRVRGGEFRVEFDRPRRRGQCLYEGRIAPPVIVQMHLGPHQRDLRVREREGRIARRSLLQKSNAFREPARRPALVGL